MLFSRQLQRVVSGTFAVLNSANQCKIARICIELQSLTVVTSFPSSLTVDSTNLFAISSKISQADVQVESMNSTARSAGM